MLHEYPAHQICGGPEKVRPALPADFPLVMEVNEGLVDKCGSLEGVSRGFMQHVPVSYPAQLLIHQGHQLIQGYLVAVSTPPQEFSNPSERLHTDTCICPLLRDELQLSIMLGRSLPGHKSR